MPTKGIDVAGPQVFSGAMGIPRYVQRDIDVVGPHVFSDI